MNSPHTVDISDVSVRYGDVVACKAVSLRIEGPGLTAVLGPSGCGKTSLLRAIAGLERPAGGTIEIDGNVVFDASTWVPPERRQVGMVFQQGALFPHLTVGQNVAYGVDDRQNSLDRTRWALELVGLQEFRDRYPDQLSGGQQQRVALARALAPGPRLVLLDEPFANLDAALRERVREEVHQILSRADATAVLVTHDQEEALSMADVVAVMMRGEIIQVAVPDELYRRPATPEVATFVGNGQLLEAEVRNGRVHSVLGEAGGNAPDGPAQVLVRPEDVRAVPANGNHEDGALGTVVRRRYFGHDVLEDVELENGQIIRVRLLSGASFDPLGKRVRLRWRLEDATVFSQSRDAVGA